LVTEGGLWPNRIDTTKQPHIDKVDLDADLIDEEFDDFLNRELFAIRETLADCRTFSDGGHP
jgi:hypothetical protein